MPRPRTGSLERRKGIYYGRLYLRDSVTGTVSRPWFCLNTTDEATAIELLAEINEHPPVPASASVASSGPRRWRAYADEWLASRRRRGVAQVDSEKGWLQNHINPVLGDPLLADIRPIHIRAVLDACVEKGLRRETIVHIRGVLRSVLEQAFDAEIIRENPLARVKMPRIRETKKERVILTDDEIEQYLACDSVDEELQLICLVARAQGGMRTRDVNSWDWSMIDRAGFGSCFVPRTKTGTPQRLAIPAGLQTRLVRRWVKAGRPTDGPVFAVRRGERKGEFKRTRGVSYAKALRRDLARAGIDRAEVFAETATTRPADFHSFRRAFSTALAEAGVDTRLAMALTGHEDPRVHERYVMKSRSMRAIPPAALPPSAIGTATELPRSLSEPGETIENIGAGHEIRTRDPQLGKLNPALRAQRFRVVTPVELEVEPQRFAMRRNELPGSATAATAGSGGPPSSDRAALTLSVVATVPSAMERSVLESVRDITSEERVQHLGVALEMALAREDFRAARVIWWALGGALRAVGARIDRHDGIIAESVCG